MKEVFEVGLDIIKKIQETQSEKLEQTGHLMAQAFMEGHKFFVSGSGHSHTMAEEMYISELSRMSNSFLVRDSHSFRHSREVEGGSRPSTRVIVDSKGVLFFCSDKVKAKVVCLDFS